MDAAKLAIATLVNREWGDVNLTIYANKPTGQYTTDSVGNRKPVTVIETLQASAREDLNPKNKPISGGSSTETYLIGRLIGVLPDWISEKSHYRAEYATKNNIKKGNFQFNLTIQNRFQDYEAARGSLISGVFTNNE